MKNDAAKSLPVSQFIGLNQPPQRPWESGSLEIELECSSRNGIVVGTPVMYRGLEVGEVTKVRLAKDAVSLLLTCVVQPDAARLVRTNSVWWFDNGLKLDAGLSGFQLKVPSLSALFRGGVSFATPTEPGEPVATGLRFPIEDEPKKDWLLWKPRLRLDSDAAGSTQNQSEVPQAIRVVANWNAGITGLYRRQSAETWGLAVKGPKLLVTKGFWDAAVKVGKSVELEFSGQRFSIESLKAETSGQLVVLIPIEGVLEFSRETTLQSIPLLDTQVPVLIQIVSPNKASPIAIEASRLKKVDAGWELNSSITLDSALDGSPVIGSPQIGAQQQLAGILTRVDGRWTVVAWSETPDQ